MNEGIILDLFDAFHLTKFLKGFFDHFLSGHLGEITHVENFNLEGKNLKIYGIDLDDVIQKYKRSQQFNLADVGAVMFAGPAGLAVTKGTDFARLAFTKAGDSTEVNHFVADWNMKNGVLAQNWL